MTTLAEALDVARNFFHAETIDVMNHGGTVVILDFENYMNIDVVLIQGDEKHVDIWIAV